MDYEVLIKISLTLVVFGHINDSLNHNFGIFALFVVNSWLLETIEHPVNC